MENQRIVFDKPFEQSAPLTEAAVQAAAKVPGIKRVHQALKKSPDVFSASKNHPVDNNNPQLVFLSHSLDQVLNFDILKSTAGSQDLLPAIDQLITTVAILATKL